VSDAALSESARGWRLIGQTLRHRWVGVAVGVAVGLCWTAAKVVVPLFVGEAIDTINAGDQDGTVRWAVVIGITGLVAALFTGLRRYWAFRESRWAEADLRERLYAHVQRLHFGFHDRMQTGELMSRANTDLQQIQNFIVLIPLTISNGVTVLAVTVILITIDPVLTLLALGSLPFLNILGKRFSTRLHPEVMAIQAESAQLASVVEETVSGVRVVKGFGAQRFQAGRLATEADDVYDASMAAARIRGRFLPAMELLPNIGLILVLGYGGHQVLDGELSLGDLASFNLYIYLLIWPLRMLGMIIAQGQRAAASGHRVAEVLDRDVEVVDPSHPRRLPTAPGGARQGLGAVRFDDVTFGYDAEHPVLSGLTLDLAPGEAVALVGPTASGKTTVARLLPRFYDVQAGQVTIDGVDVRDLSLRELRRAVGLVFEETFLFADTIGGNIAFAEPEAGLEVIERAARLAGAHEFIVELPEGYDTLVGERGFTLSGGQRQRLAIARAIIADPRILVLDDATSSVDPTKEHEIRDALAEVMAARTTLVIAHRPATIALADRVLLLEDGQVVAEGTHDELLSRSPRYREVLAAAEEHDSELAGGLA
jgi:ATP-binding cassette, subfamily B, bacterial